MNSMTKWITPLALALLTLTAACSDGDNDGNGNGDDNNDQPQVECQRLEVEDAEYCLYEQPITETGYDCPPDLANPMDFQGRTVCGAEGELPDEHRGPIGDEFDSIDDSDDLPDGVWEGSEGRRAVEALCDAPESFDGESVTISHEMLAGQGVASNSTCQPDAGPCCSYAMDVFFVPCDPDDADPVPSDDLILLIAAPSASFDVGCWKEDCGDCSGDSCERSCTPAEPDEIDSVEGVFRSGGGFHSDYDNEHLQFGEFSKAIEVTDFVPQN